MFSRLLLLTLSFRKSLFSYLYFCFPPSLPALGSSETYPFFILDFYLLLLEYECLLSAFKQSFPQLLPFQATVKPGLGPRCLQSRADILNYCSVGVLLVVSYLNGASSCWIFHCQRIHGRKGTKLVVV